MHIIFVLILAALVLLSVSMQKTYAAVPARELRRRARSGDELAGVLYRAVSYGPSLRAVLWLLTGLSSAAFFVAISRFATPLLAFLVCLMLIWLGFVWLPSSRVTWLGQRMAATIAPPLSWLLAYLHPIIDRLATFVQRHRPIIIHTGLYEKKDLADLIDRQQVQADNRIDKNALNIAKHALSFGDRLVGQKMIPQRMVKMVSADETIGPVLMTELHDSGHSRFPVYAGKRDHIVGVLYAKDLVQAKSGGKVKDTMQERVLYIHEDQDLQAALQACLKTHHHLFVVVNSFEEYVGIITLEDIIEQIIGQPIIDEFDQYDDIRAVASILAKKEHQEHQDDVKSPPPTDPKAN